MEQKGKKYRDLNRYERAMTNASLEQRLEAMAKDIEQMAIALQMSIHINNTYVSDDTRNVEVYIFPNETKELAHRQVVNDGDLFGIIEEALNKKTTPTE